METGLNPTIKSLRIKLISPRMSLRPMDSELKRRMSPSLSLVTLASLTPKPHFVYIEDENLKKIEFSDRPDLVGVNVNVDTAHRAFEISKGYRRQGIKVVFGGIHASANPDLMLQHCDAVCVGEAEELWPKMIDDLLSGHLRPIYKNPGITDLAKVPVPDWNYISKKDYIYNNIVVTSRGCPHKCDFCYNSCKYMASPYRNRPVESVIREIQSLQTRQIMFIDDNLIGNIRWTDTLLENIEPLNLVWHSAVSADIVNHPDLIRRMARSGCRSLFIGFESINSDALKSVNKRQNRIQEYENLIKLLHRNGIMVNASLVFGFDQDTPETFSRTLDWLVRNKVETMTAHILTPYPGTRLYQRLSEEGRIIDDDLSRYNTANVVFRPRDIQPQELHRGYLKIYSDFYSFKNIVRRMPENKKLIAPYLLFNFVYRKYGRFTSLIGRFGLMSQIGNLGRVLSYGIG